MDFNIQKFELQTIKNINLQDQGLREKSPTNFAKKFQLFAQTLSTKTKQTLNNNTTEESNLLIDKENNDPNITVKKKKSGLLYNVFSQWVKFVDYKRKKLQLKKIIKQNFKIWAKESSKLTKFKKDKYNLKKKLTIQKNFFIFALNKFIYKKIKALHKNQLFKINSDLVDIKNEIQKKIRFVFQQIAISKIFLNIKNIVNQKQYHRTLNEKKINKSLYKIQFKTKLKIFQYIKFRLQTKSKKIAFFEVRLNQIQFNVFQSWKKIYLNKKVINQYLIQKQNFNIYNLKKNCFNAFKIYQRYKQSKYIKIKQAERHYHIKLCSYFFPFIQIARQLQLIRIKQIKLEFYLNRKYKIKAIKNMMNNLKNVIKLLFKLKQNKNLIIKQKIFLYLKRLTEKNFIIRKQMYLARMFNKNKIQKYFFFSWYSIINKYQKQSEQIKKNNKLNKQLLFFFLLKYKRILRFKQCKLKFLIKHKNWQKLQYGIEKQKICKKKQYDCKKNSVKLTKIIAKSKKLQKIKTLIEFSRYKMSQKILNFYIHELYIKKLLNKCMKNLIQNKIESSSNK